ncbi:hypothetical protein F4803DRAFT_553371 [Xylaria telfairii]|nr:hypothetical protein F4803DRAFT_553371 [Xylaria telfairii]
MSTNGQTQNLRENLRLRSDLVFSRPGAALRVTFFVAFSARNAARLTLSANGQQLRVVNAVDFGPGGDAEAPGSGGGSPETRIGRWTQVIVDYVTRDRLLQLTFSYGLEAAPQNTVWLDQVAIFQSAATTRLPPLPLPLPSAGTTLATTVRATV